MQYQALIIETIDTSNDIERLWQSSKGKKPSTKSSEWRRSQQQQHTFTGRKSGCSDRQWNIFSLKITFSIAVPCKTSRFHYRELFARSTKILKGSHSYHGETKYGKVMLAIGNSRFVKISSVSFRNSISRNYIMFQLRERRKYAPWFRTVLKSL